MEVEELKQGPVSTKSNHLDSEKWNMKTNTEMTVDATDPVYTVQHTAR